MIIDQFDSSIVKQVDDSLEFKDNLYPEATSCFTILVEEDGKSYVLKVRKKTHNMWDDRYFYYEIHALKRAKERNLTGVTRLERIYDDDRYQAILKPFIEGTPGNRMDQGKLLDDPEFVAKLDTLYLKLRLAGITNIRFEPRKVVLSAENEITLVDLSTCLVNTEVGMLQFSQAMREDSRFITKLERNISKRNNPNPNFWHKLLKRA